MNYIEEPKMIILIYKNIVIVPLFWFTADELNSRIAAR